MEEQLHPLAVTHLLQHTLRSLCIRDNSQWVYAVFWRILPRNYPPPKWDLPGSIYDRSRGNRRNWILVWEDGFCNFAASCGGEQSASADCELQQPHMRGLQPELFFKMSHEIYNYGEGLIGKVAADHSHKWVFNEPQDQQDMSFLSAWHNPADSHPRTWEAQFQSGIKTIALIAVREGVVQLGAVNKVVEDLSYVVLLRKKFSYLESIPGVFLPHPSSAAAFPSYKPEALGGLIPPPPPMAESWSHHPVQTPTPPDLNLYSHLCGQQMKMITPSMSSLEALLSKLPSVGPATPTSVSSSGYHDAGAAAIFLSPQRAPAAEAVANGMMVTAKDEVEGDEQGYMRDRGATAGLDHHFNGGGESSSNSGSGEPPPSHAYYVNVSRPGEGF